MIWYFAMQIIGQKADKPNWLKGLKRIRDEANNAHCVRCAMAWAILLL